jgi:hypothetical protein
MKPEIKVVWDTRHAIFRSITFAIGATVRDVGFGYSPIIEKLSRIERHAIREVSFFFDGDRGQG